MDEINRKGTGPKRRFSINWGLAVPRKGLRLRHCWLKRVKTEPDPSIALQSYHQSFVNSQLAVLRLVLNIRTPFYDNHENTKR